jgi:AraC-like DNA-binding protein
MSDARASHGPRQRWSGTATIGPGWASFAGDAGDNREHAHHALQLVLSPQDTVHVWIHGNGFIKASAILLAADVPHRLLPGPARLLFLDRESDIGRQLEETCVGGLRILNEAEGHALRKGWAHAEAPELSRLLAALGLPQAPPSPLADARSDRVKLALEALLECNQWEGGLASLAAKTALSPSRCRHRVRALVGMPLRPYVRWLRLRRALALATEGASLTQAALEAGFADAAHLTRTMQRHFGVAPSAVIDALRQA